MFAMSYHLSGGEGKGKGKGKERRERRLDERVKFRS